MYIRFQQSQYTWNLRRFIQALTGIQINYKWRRYIFYPYNIIAP